LPDIALKIFLHAILIRRVNASRVRFTTARVNLSHLPLPST
jgi:hypothetical protein